MKKIGFAFVLAAMLIVPSGAMAAPTKADTKAASAQCHAERNAAPTKADFLAIGDPDYKNFGDCVKRGAKEEAAERKAARAAARAECEAAGLSGNEFAACVKEKTKENKAEADAQDKQKVNAAKTCRDEKTNDNATYVAEHGSGKNAFGKCVSAHAKAKRTGADPHA